MAAPAAALGADDNRVNGDDGEDVYSGETTWQGSTRLRSDDRASASGSEDDGADRAAVRSEGGTILGVLAQRDALMRYDSVIHREHANQRFPSILRHGIYMQSR